jgi:isopentenyl-diphosphate delta-isomerase
MEEVILVDENDQQIGQIEKIEAHRKGELHRAFSIFIFNSKGDMLLQQRALKKYHSGGLWTNACCSHPRPGEDTHEAAQRRLKEEMGIDAPIEKIFDFTYKATFDNGLTEHEFDHVFIGYYDGEVDINHDEVENYAFAKMQRIRDTLPAKSHEFMYTAWFRIAFPKVDQWWQNKQAALNQ